MHSSTKPIIIWLLSGCFLVFAMVIIGGVTRLTNSGLSIAEWNLIMGTLPPLNEQEWLETFQKYQQTPEFRLVNYHFTLDEFKSIFWWEYIHRLLGRVIGLFFIAPFLYFLFKKKLSPPLLKKLLFIFLLGAFQGFLGWFMVKSGLIKNPAVSHYRLASHLVAAFFLFGLIFWTALNEMYPKTKLKPLPPKLKKYVLLLFSVIVLQIIYGAFVAGLDAGLLYNTFPKMGGKWIAESVTALQPFWLNFFENQGGVQLIHRYIAYVVVLLVIILWFLSRKQQLEYVQQKSIRILLIIVSLQFLLGVLTLVYKVPLALGVVHQAGAFCLFTANLFLLHQARKPSV